MAMLSVGCENDLIDCIDNFSNSYRDYIEKHSNEYIQAIIDFTENQWAKDLNEISSLDFNRLEINIHLDSVNPDDYTKMCNAIQETIDKGFKEIEIHINDYSNTKFFEYGWEEIKNFFQQFIGKFQVPKTFCNLNLYWDQIDGRLNFFDKNEESEIREIVSHWNVAKDPNRWLVSDAENYFDEV